VDIDAEGLVDAVAATRAIGPHAEALVADVRDLGAVTAAVGHAVEALGRLDAALPSTLLLVQSAVTDDPMPGLNNSGPRTRNAAAEPGEGHTMHPMFVKLFIETDADDLLPEGARHRRARRSRRARAVMAVRPATPDRRHRA
jgi:hypothetical protein